MTQTTTVKRFTFIAEFLSGYRTTVVVRAEDLPEAVRLFDAQTASCGRVVGLSVKEDGQ